MAFDDLHTILRRKDAEIAAMVALRPMKDAPRDGTEILAYHKEGKNLHQVKHRDHTWMDGGTKYWGMRWNEDYRQYDGDYEGWIPMPDVVI